jgi:hypothetical protein
MILPTFSYSILNISSVTSSNPCRICSTAILYRYYAPRIITWFKVYHQGRAIPSSTRQFPEARQIRSKFGREFARTHVVGTTCRCRPGRRCRCCRGRSVTIRYYLATEPHLTRLPFTGGSTAVRRYCSCGCRARAASPKTNLIIRWISIWICWRSPSPQFTV